MLIAGRCALVVALALAGSAARLAAGEPAPPSHWEFARALDLRMGDHMALLGGQVIVRDLEVARGDELAAAGVAFVAVPLPTLSPALVGDQGSGTDMPVSAAGDEREWEPIRFEPGDRDEVKRLLQAAPGGSFNLSADEVARLRGALANVDGNGPTSMEAVSRAYREILKDRFRAYAARGIDGIAAYDRGGGAVTSPADELRGAARAAEALLAALVPDLARAIERFPAEPAPDIASRYYWRKTTIDGRPAFVLGHDMIKTAPGLAVVCGREFFVGHTYNSLQSLTILVPAGHGTMVYRWVRTYTDRVAGPFKSFERQVGQNLMKKALATELAELRERTLALR